MAPNRDQDTSPLDDERRTKQGLIFLYLAPIIGALLLGVIGSIIAHTLAASARMQLGGSFRLAATSGGMLGSDDLAGKPYLMFFGYTRCPDICPTVLVDLSALVTDLKKSGRPPIKILFVTLDPERDTVETLRDYVSSFGDGIIGLTGTPDQIRSVAEDFHVYYGREAMEGGDYAISHSGIVYLMDGHNQFVTAMPMGNHDEALDLLRKAVDEAHAKAD
jgi:protein SCO1